MVSKNDTNSEAPENGKKLKVYPDKKAKEETVKGAPEKKRPRKGTVSPSPATPAATKQPPAKKSPASTAPDDHQTTNSTRKSKKSSDTSPTEYEEPIEDGLDEEFDDIDIDDIMPVPPPATPVIIENEIIAMKRKTHRDIFEKCLEKRLIGEMEIDEWEEIPPAE